MKRVKASTFARIILGHVVGCYAAMLTLDALAWELDHRIYRNFVLFTAIAPVGGPLLIVQTIAGIAKLKLIVIPTLVIPYLAVFLVTLRWGRRQKREGFSVLPIAPNAPHDR
jgi:hypothetical protein